MPEFIQPSFSKGEISPALYSRVDTALYASALRKAKNVVIKTSGGASNRSGFDFVGPARYHDKLVRLKRFEFNVESMYVLEFGHLYMRVILDGGHVLESSKSITGATQANPCVITSTSHGYSNGDEVEITGIVGMTELNGQRFNITGVTANTFQLLNQVTGGNINSSGYTPYVSGGQVARVYTIVTPYKEEDLFQLKFAQSSDVMTIVHNLYSVGELTRTGHTSWTLTEPIFAPTQAFPSGVSVTPTGPGTTTHLYAVTAIAGESFSGNSFEESLTGTKATGVNITGATKATPCVITAVSHGFLDGDEITITGVVGMTELNGRRYIVEGATANTFELTDQATGEDINSTGYTTYSSGGLASQVFVRITNSNAVPNNTISWTAASGALRYAVYRANNGIFGLLGETELLSFVDNNMTPNLSFSPPHARNPFLLSGETPGAVSYYEQRRVFGGSLNRPDTSFYSQVSSSSNMSTSFPVQADDAITATLASDTVNEIRHFVPGNDLIIFTSGGEWRINSGIDSAFTAATIKQKPQSLWGSAHVPPIKSGNTTLFITPSKKGIRSFGYSASLDGYEGSDILLWANHLLETYGIEDWTEVRFAEPLNIGVRADGKIIALTYSQEQEVIAWAVWDTLGEWESVASMRGGEASDEELYAVVKRQINNRTVKYIERMQSRTITDARDSFFVDSGLSLDDPRDITLITLVNPVIVTAPNHGFAEGDEVDISDVVWISNYDIVGNETQPDQLNTRRYTISDVTVNTFQLDGVDGTEFNGYLSGGKVRKAVDTISGLGHLEGSTVQVLADGNVISDVVIVNGGFTLPVKASRVHAGLRYISDIETPDIEPQQGTLQGKLKKITKAVVRFYRSRGLFVGPDSANLTELKQREFEKIGDPTDLFSGDKEVTFGALWNTHGRILMRQIYPLPMNITAVIPSLTVSD